MADGTAIEWARHPVTGRGASWNPILARRLDTGELGYHCEHVSEACRFCYAETFNRRHLAKGGGRGTGLDFKPGHRNDVAIILDAKTLELPLRWKEPRGIFVCSMTDLFGEFVANELIDKVFAIMALCPQHVFFVLTKRPERMRAWVTKDRHRTAPVECIAELYVEHPSLASKWPFDEHRAIGVGTRGWPLPNVWLGVSVEDQVTADTRIPYLLSTPAAVRFISAEPLLGPIDLRRIDGQQDALAGAVITHVPQTNAAGLPDGGEYYMPIGRKLDWVIVGGESGPGARPMHPGWARSLRDDCAEVDVPYFMKQWGSWLPGQFDELPGHSPPSRAPHHQDGTWGPLRRPQQAPVIPWYGLATEPNFVLWSSSEASALHLDPGDLPRDMPPHLRFATRIGKKAAGRLLDGVEHNAMPEVQA